MAVTQMLQLDTGSEDVGAGIAAQSEVVVMAVGAVRLVILARERTIDQRHLAVDTLEAVLVPVTVLVRQILYTSHTSNIQGCRGDGISIPIPTRYRYPWGSLYPRQIC